MATLSFQQHSDVGRRRAVVSTCAALAICLSALGCPQPDPARPDPARPDPALPVEASASSEPAATVSEPPATVASPEAEAQATFPAAKIPSLSPRVLTSAEAAEGDWFEDRAAQLGVDFVYSDGSRGGGYQLIESVGGGVACLDYDRDGWQDLFFVGGGDLTRQGDTIEISGRSEVLYRSRSGTGFSDVSPLAGVLLDSQFLTHGTTAADIDADGFTDIVVAGFEGTRVWMNQGDGTFSERARALGLENTDWNTTACAADYDGDGLVDVYLLTYAAWQPDPLRICRNDRGMRDICGPTLFAGARDAMFRHSGQGYSRVTDDVDLVPANRGLGIVAADLDENGWIDFAVVNDVEENQLYMNSGQGALNEEGSLQGIAYSNTGEREGSMGIDLGDYNRDGYADLWYTNYVHQDNSLMKSVQGQGFVHAEGSVGLTGVSRRWVGFGTGFADFDCDGWEDLFVVNGHVAYQRLDSPYYQPAQLFQNEKGNRFHDVSRQGGPYFAVDRSGRGAAKVDLDNNGSPDLVIVHQNEPAAVLTNLHPADHWIRLELVGTVSERGAVGAKATIAYQDRQLSRWVIGGGSYLSHSDSRLLFPLDSAEPVRVEVTWLGGETEVFTELQPNRSHVLVQGSS